MGRPDDRRASASASARRGGKWRRCCGRGSSRHLPEPRRAGSACPGRPASHRESCGGGSSEAPHVEKGNCTRGRPRGAVASDATRQCARVARGPLILCAVRARSQQVVYPSSVVLRCLRGLFLDSLGALSARAASGGPSADLFFYVFWCPVRQVTEDISQVNTSRFRVVFCVFSPPAPPPINVDMRCPLRQGGAFDTPKFRKCRDG